MIFVSLNNKELFSADFNNWDEWVLAVNNDIKYCEENPNLEIPVGVRPCDLPSNHPYWVRYSKEELRKSYLITISKADECIKDGSKTKYLFNIAAIPEKIKYEYEQKLKAL